MALRSFQKYKCAGNLFWLACARLSNPMVPIYDRNIDQLQQTYFQEPADMPYTIIVGLDPGTTGRQILDRRGSLLRLSPEDRAAGAFQSVDAWVGGRMNVSGLEPGSVYILDIGVCVCVCVCVCLCAHGSVSCGGTRLCVPTPGRGAHPPGGGSSRTQARMLNLRS